MADIGYRKKGDTGPMYNPERDYAYITPTLMRVAIERLEANESVERKNWREKEKISDEDINAVALALANAQRDFVNAADPVQTFEQALQRHNFYDSPYAVRQYLFATVGEVFCAAWFKAVREVSIVGEESPAHTDMARFCATVRDFINQQRGVTYDANFMAEHLRMTVDILQGRIQLLGNELRDQRIKLSKCEEEFRARSAAQKRVSVFSWLRGLFRKNN